MTNTLTFIFLSAFVLLIVFLLLQWALGVFGYDFDFIHYIAVFAILLAISILLFLYNFFFEE